MAAALTLFETRMPSGRTLEPDLVLTSIFMVTSRVFKRNIKNITCKWQKHRIRSMKTTGRPAREKPAPTPLLGKLTMFYPFYCYSRLV